MMSIASFWPRWSCVLALVLRRYGRAQPAYESIDAIVPAFNEEICITRSIEDLLWNAYINRVIAVNDGSTDGTAAVLDESPRSTNIWSSSTRPIPARAARS